MPSPFPGMNPFLESPAVWPGFHASMITAVRNAINGVAPETYFADIEQRVFLVKPGDPYQQVIVPDVAVAESQTQPSVPVVTAEGGTAVAAVTPSIRVQMLEEEISERFITIRSGPDETNSEIVAIIELVSPSNKLVGSSGHKSYLAKREEILNSRTHFIEIDLLRGGDRRPLGPGGYSADYLITLSRTEERPMAELWPTNLPAKLPTIPIPLMPGDDDLVIDLQKIFHQVYDESGYDRRIRLTDPIPKPELSAKNAEWIKQFTTKS